MNAWAGKPVLVLGKYSKNPLVYEDMWCWTHMGDNLPKQGYRYVSMFGHTFRIYCYDDELLRQAQLEDLYLATAQCAGRARSLWYEGAEAYIISDVPIEDATIIDFTPYNGKERK